MCAVRTSRSRVREYARASKWKGLMLAPPSEFVFGGLRIVWISNDCAPSPCQRTTRFPRLSDLPSSYDPLPFLLPAQERVSFVFWEAFLFPLIFKRNLYLRVYRSRENCCAFETKYVTFFRFQKYLDFRFLFNREKDIIRISPIKV